MLTPVFDPLDWLAKSQRHQGYDHFFGIGARLHAKPPPTSGATTEYGAPATQRLGQRPLHKVRKLRGAPDRQAAIEAVRITDQPTALGGTV